MHKLLVSLILPLALVGCLTTGRDFPSELNWIKEKNTKQTDVKMVLGDPYAVGHSDGAPTWTYAFYRYELFGKSYFKELKFYWGPKQDVERFSFNSSFPKDIEKK